MLRRILSTMVSFSKDVSEGIEVSSHYYAQAEQEIDDDDVDRGLWAKALVKAKGNETVRKAEYIKLRAEELQKQDIIKAKQVRIINRQIEYKPNYKMIEVKTIKKESLEELISNSDDKSEEVKQLLLELNKKIQNRFILQQLRINDYYKRKYEFGGVFTDQRVFKTKRMIDRLCDLTHKTADELFGYHLQNIESILKSLTTTSKHTELVSKFDIFDSEDSSPTDEMTFFL